MDSKDLLTKEYEARKRRRKRRNAVTAVLWRLTAFGTIRLMMRPAVTMEEKPVKG